VRKPPLRALPERGERRYRISVVTTWDDSGLLVVPGFFAPEECRRLRVVCDRVLERVLADPARGDEANIAFLTRREPFGDDLESLLVLLEAIAHPRIRALLEPLGPAPLRFFNTQYFHEQRSRDWDGAWHRDTQFEAPDPSVERKRIAETDALHFRVAFEPDDRLEIVPGSHRRWDAPEELAIRRGPEPTRPDMPGRRRIALRPGDACAFHAWTIHRGTYRTAPPRRTLDLIYAFGPATDFGQPAPPETFRDPEIRARLSPEALSFYDVSTRR
jgi:hypothetical protein